VFAAEILAFIGRSATMSRLGFASSTTCPRLAQFGRALHCFQALGVQLGTTMILEH
jgi:hypothetical protein